MVANASARLANIRRAVALAVILSLAACEEWHLSVNSDGLVFISIVGDGAGRPGFRLRTRTGSGVVQTLAVPASGALGLTQVAGGELELTLLLPDRCRVDGPNPRTLTVHAGREIRLAFDVHCA
jgi:hypothetical protein